MTQIIHFT